MARLSVIVPVFNKERYLDEALDSLLSQTFQDVEVVIVDNGSTDASRAIAARRAAADDRIVLVDEPRRGAAAARNKGLETATGDFVGFLDADDVIDSAIYETLMGLVVKTGAEVATCGYARFDDDPSQLYRAIVPFRSDAATPAELGGDLFHVTTPSVCTKVFSADLLQRIGARFDESLSVAEDALFTFTALLHASRIAFSNQVLYRYRQGVMGQVTRRGDLFDVFRSYGRLAGEVERQPDAEAYRDGFGTMLLGQARWALNEARSPEEFDALFQELRVEWLPRLVFGEHVDGELSLYVDSASSHDLLFFQNRLLRKRVDDLSLELDVSRRRQADVEGSRSFRIGFALTALPRVLKRRFTT